MGWRLKAQNCLWPKACNRRMTVFMECHTSSHCLPVFKDLLLIALHTVVAVVLHLPGSRKPVRGTLLSNEKSIFVFRIGITCLICNLQQWRPWSIFLSEISTLLQTNCHLACRACQVGAVLGHLRYTLPCWHPMWGLTVLQKLQLHSSKISCVLVFTQGNLSACSLYGCLSKASCFLLSWTICMLPVP